MSKPKKPAEPEHHVDEVQFSCAKALQSIDQVIAGRRGQVEAKEIKSSRELDLALESAAKAVADAKAWVKEANAVIEAAKLDCPAL